MKVSLLCAFFEYGPDNLPQLDVLQEHFMQLEALGLSEVAVGGSGLLGTLQRTTQRAGGRQVLKTGPGADRSGAQISTQYGGYRDCFVVGSFARGDCQSQVVQRDLGAAHDFGGEHTMMDRRAF